MPTVKLNKMSQEEVKDFIEGKSDTDLEEGEEFILLDKHKVNSFIHRCCSCGRMHEIELDRLRGGWSIRFYDVDEKELFDREVISVRELSSSKKRRIIMKHMWVLENDKGKIIKVYVAKCLGRDVYVYGFVAKADLLAALYLRSEKELEPGEKIRKVEFEV